MKKVLALVLAVVLAFGMTTVAFATPALTADGSAKAGKASQIEIGSTPMTYDDANSGTMTAVTGDLAANTTYYLSITDAGGKMTRDSGNQSQVINYVNKLSALSEYKLRTAIDEGAGYISAKPTFVMKKVGATTKGYVTFKTADKFNKEAVSIVMSVVPFSGSAAYTPKDYDTAYAAYISRDVAYGSTDASLYTVIDGPLVNFDNVEEECELEFLNDVVFKVNGKDQKDLFLRMGDTDDALETKYPDADLSIVKFEGNNKTFRRTGTLTIPADMVENKDGKMVAPVLYNYEGGKLTVNKEAKYNEETQAFEIKTNKLGNYVVSASELKATSTTEPGTEEPAAPGTEPNPDTGANDFVGLAVALAVVSVAGIAVAKRK